MAAVDKIIVHHEGAGAPTNNVSRFLNTAKYSIGIGISLFEVRRSPWDSFHTTGIPGDALQVCFSGNRDVWAVTDNDIELFRAAVAEARYRGWVVANPAVYLHGDNGLTACPGNHAEARRDDFINAAKPPALLPPPPTGDSAVALSVADPTRLGTPLGRTRIASLILGHGVAMINGARVHGDTGPSPYGIWFADASWVPLAKELVQVPGGFVVLLTDNGTIGPVYFKD